MDLLPENAEVLDLGCGSGRDTLFLEDEGFSVTAMDGSARMCELAEIHTGRDILHLRVEDMEFDDVFHGIWACAVLGHFPPDKIQEVMQKILNALKDDGIMVNQQGSPFYAEDAHAMQRSHKRIASTFQISRVYQAHIPTFAAGYWLFGFASKKYHPVDDLDAEAWNALNLRTRYYTTRLHKGAFYLPAFLEDMLKEVED